MGVPTADLPKSAGHPFCERLNRVLDEAGFDTFVEAQCASFYADGIGRPSLAPGRYFRLLLLGYFEGLDSERAIAQGGTVSGVTQVSRLWKNVCANSVCITRGLMPPHRIRILRELSRLYSPIGNRTGRGCLGVRSRRKV